MTKARGAGDSGPRNGFQRLAFGGVQGQSPWPSLPQNFVDTASEPKLNNPPFCPLNCTVWKVWVYVTRTP